MDLEQIHDCEKCHGKIVCISVDALGRTKCVYCNEVVDYSKAQHPDMKAFLERLAEDEE